MGEDIRSPHSREDGLREDEEKCQVQAAGKGLGIRHLQTVLMAMGTFIGYAGRTTLNVAIIAMTPSTEGGPGNITTSEQSHTFIWSEETQDYVLGSFFFGYLFTQIPAGILTERFGGHTFLCSATFVSSLLTSLLPQCAYIGDWKLVWVNRVAQGLAQGFLLPSVYTLLGLWAPPGERSRLASFSIAGTLLGTVAALPICGLLISVYGWPSVFYSFGAVGVSIAAVMYFFGADSPAVHKFISESEKYYIERSLDGAKTKLPVPWKCILTSVPVWSSVITLSLSSLVSIVFFVKMPTYLSTVLHFDIKENGFISSIPYLVSWLLNFIFSWSCDLLSGRGWLKLTTARKLFNSIAFFGGALCIVLMAYAQSRAMSVLLITISTGLYSAIFSGVQSNFVDLSPNFSGPIFGLCNFFCATFGFLGPIFVGLTLTDVGSVEQWRNVFLFSAAIYVLSNVIFLISSTAETQWWNWPVDSDKCKNAVLKGKTKAKETQAV